jgi:hypothetical protein
MKGGFGPYQLLGIVLVVAALGTVAVLPGYAGLVVPVVLILAGFAIYTIDHDGPSI